MIRYLVNWDELDATIDKAYPNWRARAKERIEYFISKEGYQEPPSSFWSEIKPVFMMLQYNKCAYCERKLGPRIEHDVEHFRPKRGVDKWPIASGQNEGTPAYNFNTGESMQSGYYRLAYNLRNYAIACKPCNSNLKKSYFPIAANRVENTDDFERLIGEQPLLIYPLGDIDSDPTELITFKGVTPVPIDLVGFGYKRARVTIDFFQLKEREELLIERGEVIRDCWTALYSSESHDPEIRDFGKAVVRQMLHPFSRHSNCANAFYVLYNSDRSFAKQIAREALNYLESLVSPN